MKITQGFVAVKADGTFIAVSQRSTHTGFHTNFYEVSSIDDASVFPSKHFNNQGREKPDFPVIFVPVEVRREVILKGYGTNG